MSHSQSQGTPVTNTVTNPFILLPAIAAVLGFGTYDLMTLDPSDHATENQPAVIAKFEDNLADLTARHNTQDALQTELLSVAVNNLLSPEDTPESDILPTKDEQLKSDTQAWLNALFLTADISEENKGDLLEDFHDAIQNTDDFQSTANVAYLDECRIDKGQGQFERVTQSKQAAESLAQDIRRCSNYMADPGADDIAPKDATLLATILGTPAIVFFLLLFGTDISRSLRQTERLTYNKIENWKYRRREKQTKGKFCH